MKYKGKRVEIISSKMLFGKETVWIHILEDNTFEQVLRSDLEEEITSSENSSMAYVRYISIAARIKEEMAQKRLLAPYESSLIPPSSPDSCFGEGDAGSADSFPVSRRGGYG